MDVFEIDDTLKSFSVLIDTREQATPRATERFTTFGVPYKRATLKYSDYCGNVILPGGQPLYDPSVTISPRCCIERKMSLDELATCFTRGRDRFRREFERACEAEAVVYLLVENGSWEAIANHRYRSRFNSDAFLASLVAWMIRYDLRPIFCKAGTSGKMIKEILFRDMKARLERGEYG